MEIPAEDDPAPKFLALNRIDLSSSDIHQSVSLLKQVIFNLITKVVDIFDFDFCFYTEIETELCIVIEVALDSFRLVWIPDSSMLWITESRRNLWMRFLLRAKSFSVCRWAIKWSFWETRSIEATLLFSTSCSILKIKFEVCFLQFAIRLSALQREIKIAARFSSSNAWNLIFSIVYCCLFK